MHDPDIEANIKAVLENEKREADKLSHAEKLAQRFTALSGTVGFGVFHVVFFTVWIGFNVTPWAFDKYPFNFLTMTVSLESIFLSITLLIAQNFLSKTQDRRAALDLQINLLAEKEDTAALKLLIQIAQKLGVELSDEEVHRMTEKIDPTEVLQQIASYEDQ